MLYLEFNKPNKQNYVSEINLFKKFSSLKVTV